MLTGTKLSALPKSLACAMLLRGMDLRDNPALVLTCSDVVHILGRMPQLTGLFLSPDSLSGSAAALMAVRMPLVAIPLFMAIPLGMRVASPGRIFTVLKHITYGFLFTVNVARAHLTMLNWSGLMEWRPASGLLAQQSYAGLAIDIIWINLMIHSLIGHYLRR